MATAEQNDHRVDEHSLPPGTSYLLHKRDAADVTHVHLVPTPSTNPNEPLNWSRSRKFVNFFLVQAVTLAAFTILTIQALFWEFFVVEFDTTFVELNNSLSIASTSLSLGCVFFIPFAIKFGRRPVYIASTLLIFVMSIWMSRMKSIQELYVINFLVGLGSAANEGLVMMTVADLFFVHERGTMNGIYISVIILASFLSPMIAGIQATSQGWRWSYYMQSIFTGVLLLLIIFFFEETKYTPSINGQQVRQPRESQEDTQNTHPPKNIGSFSENVSIVEANAPISARIDSTIPMTTKRERLAWYTPTSEPFWPLVYRPFIILFTFPIMMFTALQYTFLLCWQVNISVTIGTIMPYAPYNFSAAARGYIGVGPLIGCLFGGIYSGPITNRAILFFARRNKGFYEPEMRLYLHHLPSAAVCGGLAMFGITLSRGMHWIYPTIGSSIFAFGLSAIADTTVTYVIDSYRDITGEAFIGITFIRNAFAIWMAQVRTPWQVKMGVQNEYISMAFIAFGVCLLYIPMIYIGKPSRKKLAEKYYGFAKRA